MKRSPRLLAITLLAAELITGCGGSTGTRSPVPVTYTAAGGVAQKGPLQQGSTVTAQELDASLSPNGKQYSYQITSNLGTFSPTSTFSSRYLGLIATGYYFDEVAGDVSAGTITLNSYSDLATDSVPNVNLLTTLTYQRIQTLMSKSNLTFPAARTQAEGEVLAAFGIPNPGHYGSFGTLDISKGTDGANILAAISSLFVYGNTSGTLSGLIANVQSDIGANGAITNTATQQTLVASARALNPGVIASNLNQEYASAGVTFTAANISDWIDQDGDGVIGKNKFQVTDAGQSSVFVFSTSITDTFAGTSISVSAGQLLVNGNVVSGEMSIKAGDVISVSPPAGTFPNGALNIYLLSGSTRVARVTFVAGLASISVTPDNAAAPIGTSVRLTATGTFSDASTADLSSSVVWSSGATQFATINANSGLASAIALGQSIITATSGAVSGSTNLNVTAAVIESIAVTPAPFAMNVGVTGQMHATGTYSDGSTADVTSTAVWSTTAGSIATVTGGLLTGVGAGSTSAAAMVGSVSGTGQVTVSTSSWTSAGSMATGLLDHGAVLLPNGKALVVGGDAMNTDGSYSIVASAQVYDPAANTWASTAGMANARTGFPAVRLSNGNVLVIGGLGQPSPISPILASAELYNPTSGQWSSAGTMGSTRFGHTATVLANGKVLVTGGGIDDVGPLFIITGILSSAEIYDPVTNTWSPAASMSTARSGHTATLLANGKVLVDGGFPNVSAQTVLASAEIYDPNADTWSPAGSMNAARSQHVAALLPNGKVLVASGSADLSSAEIYDPSSNSWTVTGSMNNPRGLSAAVTLTDGTVLVAGGADAGTVLGSAEIFNSSTGAWTPTLSLVTSRANLTLTLLNTTT